MDDDWFAHPGRHCRGVDPNVFFGQKGSNADAGHAKAHCFGCPVRGECLEYAIADPSLHGVWGGLTFQERRTMRRERGIQSRMSRIKPGALCGSASGYNRHRMNNEPACPSCLEARAAYEAERRARRDVA